MNTKFAEVTNLVPALFEQLAESPTFYEKGIVAQKRRAGIYVFFDEGLPVNIGRTRNLQGRLRGHTSLSHYSASFGFKRARRALGQIASYKPEGSRSALAADETFRPEFHRHVGLVRAMGVKFIEVKDPVVQYLLELYAHLEYGLPLDEFDTH